MNRYVAAGLIEDAMEHGKDVLLLAGNGNEAYGWLRTVMDELERRELVEATDVRVSGGNELVRFARTGSPGSIRFRSVASRSLEGMRADVVFIAWDPLDRDGLYPVYEQARRMVLKSGNDGEVIVA